MSQFSKVLLAIDNAHPVPQRALDCSPGLCGLPSPPTPLPYYHVEGAGNYLLYMKQLKVTAVQPKRVDHSIAA